MIGSAYKKFARQNGLNVAHGVAYGDLRGYAATLSEGAGYKKIVISTRFPDMSKQLSFQAAISQRQQYKIQELTVEPDRICIEFYDTTGTLKRISAFLDWFMPLLSQYGATPANVCPECGKPAPDGQWKLVDGLAVRLHPACAEAVKHSVEADNQEKKLAGSYATGLVGALLGALIGSIMFAVVLRLGFVASLVGLLIGFLAEIFYNLLKGRQGKGKVLILILAIIVGVCFGSLLEGFIEIYEVVGAYGLTFSEMVALLFETLETSSEAMTQVVANAILGLIFAFLGTFSLLRRTSKQLSDSRIIDLP